MRIKKGDKIQVISGKDNGKQGKVIDVFPSDNKVAVEKINIIKKHLRPKKQGEKGEIVEIAVPMNVSNVILVCPKCSKLTRIEYKINKKEKNRVCKKCSELI